MEYAWNTAWRKRRIVKCKPLCVRTNQRDVALNVIAKASRWQDCNHFSTNIKSQVHGLYLYIYIQIGLCFTRQIPNNIWLESDLREWNTMLILPARSLDAFSSAYLYMLIIKCKIKFRLCYTLELPYGAVLKICRASIAFRGKCTLAQKKNKSLAPL